MASRSDDMARQVEGKHSTYMFDVMFTAKGKQTLVNISNDRGVLYSDDSVGRHGQPVSQLMAVGGQIWPLIGHDRMSGVLERDLQADVAAGVGLCLMSAKLGRGGLAPRLRLTVLVVGTWKRQQPR